MKHLNWVLSAAMFATSTVGFAVGLEYEGRNNMNMAAVEQELFAAQRVAMAKSKGPSWLIYRDSEDGAIGQIIQKAGSKGSHLEVTVQGADNQVTTHRVKYLTQSRAEAAAQNLNDALNTGSGLSLDVSSCVSSKVVSRVSEKSTGVDGDPITCERIYSTLSVDCDNAAFAPTPQRLVDQTALTDEMPITSELVCPRPRVILQFRE